MNLLIMKITVPDLQIMIQDVHKNGKELGGKTI
jgi:hypothetical protein